MLLYNTSEYKTYSNSKFLSIIIMLSVELDATDWWLLDEI